MTRADGPTLAELIAGALDHDQFAWNQIVERYTPLVIASARRHHLSEQNVVEVSQRVWEQAVKRLGDLRGPGTLPSYLTSTTRYESLRILGRHRRQPSMDPANAEAETLDKSSRQQDLLAVFAELPDLDRRLLMHLLPDSNLTYAELSDRIGISVGAIATARARTLARLGAAAAVCKLIP